MHSASDKLVGEIQAARLVADELRQRAAREEPAQLLAATRWAISALPVRRLRRREAGRAVLRELYGLLAELAESAGRAADSLRFALAAANLSLNRGRSVGDIASHQAGSRSVVSNDFLAALQLCRGARGREDDTLARARGRLLTTARGSLTAEGNIHAAKHAALRLFFAEPSQEAAIEVAKVMLAYNRPQRALTVLRHAERRAAKTPSPQLHFWLAWSLLATGDTRGANTVVSSLLTDPQIGTEPVVRLAQLICRVGERTALPAQGMRVTDRVEVSDLTSLTQRVAKGFPLGAGEACFCLAKWDLANGRGAAGVAQLRRCLEFWPGHRPARLLLARILARIGSEDDLDLAEMEARIALRMHPLSAEAHVALLYILGRRLDDVQLARRRRILGWRLRGKAAVLGLAEAMAAVSQGDAEAAIAMLTSVKMDELTQDDAGLELLGWHALCQIEARAMQGDYEIGALVEAALALPIEAMPLDLPLLALAAARRRKDREGVERWHQAAASQAPDAALSVLLNGPRRVADEPPISESANRSQVVGDLARAKAMESTDRREALRSYRELTERTVHDDMAACCVAVAAKRVRVLAKKAPDGSTPSNAILVLARRRWWILPPQFGKI